MDEYFRDKVKELEKSIAQWDKEWINRFSELREDIQQKEEVDSNVLRVLIVGLIVVSAMTCIYMSLTS